METDCTLDNYQCSNAAGHISVFLYSDVFYYYHRGLLLRYMLSAIACKLTSNFIRSIIYPEKN